MTIKTYKDLAELIEDGVSISLFGGRFYRGYSTEEGKEFEAKLIKNTSSVKLELAGHGPSPESAIDAAVLLWNNTVNHGVEEFQGHLLEAPPSLHKDLNDDIPF